MDFKLHLLLLIWITPGILSDPICYDQLGCFYNNYPWFQLLRPFPMPQSPQQVNTTFFFSNRAINKSYIQTWPIIQMHSQFDAQKPTYFLTHGFSSSSDTPWFYNLTEALLSKHDGNVFTVDWTKGSSGNYFSAASNTRTVAAEILRIMDNLRTKFSLNPATVHLLGHSLGAHIMSYVGKNTTNPKIHRITALDPAQPGFQGKNPLIRLNASDAIFIDVVHTDGKPFLPFLGLGMTSGVGDVDFFVNGGKWQPNCVLDGESFPYKSLSEVPKITITILYNLATCSHSRAPRYMAAAVKENCHMWGHRYNATIASLRWENFVIDDNCQDTDSCTILGLEASRLPARGNFAMETSGVYPFCLNDTVAEENMRINV